MKPGRLLCKHATTADSQIRDQCTLCAFVYTIGFPLKKNKRKSAKKRPCPVNPCAAAWRGNALLSRGCIKDPVLLTGMSLGLFLHITLHTEVSQDHIHTCTHKAVRYLVRLTEGNTIPVDGKEKGLVGLGLL